MHQKLFTTLGTSSPQLPALAIVEHNRSDLIVGLRGLGWRRLGDSPVKARGSVFIAETHVRITMAGESVLSLRSGESGAPPGWHEAVTAQSGHCLVAVMGAENLCGDYEETRLLDQLVSPDLTACALLPVLAAQDKQDLPLCVSPGLSQPI